MRGSSEDGSVEGFASGSVGGSVEVVGAEEGSDAEGGERVMSGLEEGAEEASGK